MTAVIVTRTAQRDLDALIRTQSLPPTTREWVRRSIQPLERFPRIGASLHGRWSGFRLVLGPWRWMIVVYHYDEETDRVAIVTIQDGRSARAATSSSGASEV